MAKPSDFFIGVMDFFGILLPGAAFVYLLQPLVVSDIPVKWLPSSSTQQWAVFLMLSYITGHLLHAIGGWVLDKYLYKWYLRKYQSPHWKTGEYIEKHDRAGLQRDKEAVETLLARVYLTTNADPRGTNYYDWCLSDLRMKCPAGAREVDRQQADSKFFRSSFFVSLLTWCMSLWFLCTPHGPYFALVIAALTFFAAWRFCELRWTATKRVYEYYLLLHAVEKRKENVTKTPYPA